MVWWRPTPFACQRTIHDLITQGVRFICPLYPFCAGYHLLSFPVVKLPQLLRVLRSQSTVGLSLSLYALELLSQTVAVLYHRVHNFELSTYGENITLGAGNMAMLAAFAKINKDPRAFISLFLPLVLTPLTRFPSLLAFLQSLSIPLNIASKLPQIVINHSVATVMQRQMDATRKAWKARHQQQHSHHSNHHNAASLTPPSTVTPMSPASPAVPALPSSPPSFPSSPSFSSHRLPSSQLSSIPFALNFLGSLSRLYTTRTQLDSDRIMLLGFIISCILNGTIVLQCWNMKRMRRNWEKERQMYKEKHG